MTSNFNLSQDGQFDLAGLRIHFDVVGLHQVCPYYELPTSSGPCQNFRSGNILKPEAKIFARPEAMNVSTHGIQTIGTAPTR